MTAAPDLHKQVTHNTEDIDALHDLLKKTKKRVTKIAAVQREHGAKLDSHSQKLDSHSQKLDSHSVMLNSHGHKLDEILGLLRQER